MRTKKRKLSKDDLALAQTLLHALESISGHAARLDPEMRKGNYLVNMLDNSLGTMSTAFTVLTGRHYSTVTMTELSTETPAKWTREIEVAA
jgi:hypothetical protein